MMRRGWVLVFMLTAPLTIGIAPRSGWSDRPGDEPRIRTIDLGIRKLFVQIEFVDARIGFAVGGNQERGTPAGLIRTEDGGETWQETDGRVAARLYDISFPTPAIGFAGGIGGRIIKSTDGGKTWTETPGFEAAWIAGAHFVDAQRGFVVGANAGMLFAMTEDGGETWRSITDRVPEEVRSIDLRAIHFVDAKVGIAVGSNGLLLRTVDGGTTWTRCATSTDAWLKSISFPTRATGYVAGSNGVVLRTDDAGETWRALSLPEPVKLNGVAFISPERGIIAGAAGEIFSTTNGATTWHRLERPDAGGLTNAHAGPNDVIWVTTETGVLLRVEWPAAVMSDDEHASSAGD